MTWFVCRCSAGEITVRTHTSVRVVNQQSRFHTTAGIHGQFHHHHQSFSSTPGISTPLSPASSISQAHQPLVSPRNTLSPADTTELPPATQPVTVFPLLQIKQPYLAAGKLSSISTYSNKCTVYSHHYSYNVCIQCTLYTMYKDLCEVVTNGS